MLSRPLDSLYFAHTVLEIFLGLIKFVRGRYQHEAVGSRTGRGAMYVRHHGSSILALALLSGLVLYHGVVDSETGRCASAVLAVFHGGAVWSFLYAWVEKAIPLQKVLVPHLPFAVAFTLHALSSLPPCRSPSAVTFTIHALPFVVAFTHHALSFVT